MQNTNNNQEIRNFIEETCENCGLANKIKDEYKLQECIHCNSKILPGNHKDVVKVKEIHEVNTAHNLIYSYDFQMPFDFENSKEINEFLDEEMICNHMVFCEVNYKDGEFDLDTARYGVSWYCEDSCNYDFSEEQIATIKKNVSKYIVSNKLGKIKDRKRELLEKVCEYYGCSLEIRPNNSVLLEDFVDAEFKNITDALIYFYIDFLKDDWNDIDDLKLLEDLIEKKALNTVLNWMDDYSYSLISKTRVGENIFLLVEDLELNPNDEDCITKHTLDYWCNYFIEEIYNKNVEEEVRQHWIKEDVEPMELYLSRDKSKERDNKNHKLTLSSNLNEKDSTNSTNNKVNATKFEMKYDIDLSLEFKENVYIVSSSFPIALLLDDKTLEFVNKFYFIKQQGEYSLKFAETINNKQVYHRNIMNFLNMDTKEFLKICSKLCNNYISSYIKVNDEVYIINSIIDFLKINDLDEVEISDIEYSFNLKDKDLLNELMIDFHKCKFKEVLQGINDKVIFGEKMLSVAREYANRVLKIDDTQLKYMDYLGYFKNEVSYEIIDDYIVVFI